MASGFRLRAKPSRARLRQAVWRQSLSDKTLACGYAPISVRCLRSARKHSKTPRVVACAGEFHPLSQPSAIEIGIYIGSCPRCLPEQFTIRVRVARSCAGEAIPPVQMISGIGSPQQLQQEHPLASYRVGQSLHSAAYAQKLCRPVSILRGIFASLAVSTRFKIKLRTVVL
jgi:hypothetical protein